MILRECHLAETWSFNARKFSQDFQRKNPREDSTISRALRDSNNFENVLYLYSRQKTVIRMQFNKLTSKPKTELPFFCFIYTVNLCCALALSLKTSEKLKHNDVAWPAKNIFKRIYDIFICLVFVVFYPKNPLKTTGKPNPFRSRVAAWWPRVSRVFLIRNRWFHAGVTQRKRGSHTDRRACIPSLWRTCYSSRLQL